MPPAAMTGTESDREQLPDQGEQADVALHVPPGLNSLRNDRIAAGVHGRRGLVRRPGLRDH